MYNYLLDFKTTLFRLVRYWFIPALMATVIFGTIYATVQQALRQSANDPQIQIATEIASRIENGQNPQSLIPQDKIDISSSLTTFVVLYNESGKPINSNAQIDKQMPEVPNGVLDAAKKNDRNILTWEPKSGLRFATVVIHVKSQNVGFVLVGRSLKEVELRETKISYIVLVGWLSTLLLIFLVSIFMPDRNTNFSGKTKAKEDKDLSQAEKQNSKKK